MQSSLLSYGSQNASFGRDADDASALLGHVHSLHGQASFASSAAAKQHASFGYDAADASAPLGHVQPLHGQASIASSTAAKQHASFGRDADVASVPFGPVQSMHRQADMLSSTAQRQSLTVAVTATSALSADSHYLDCRGLRFSNEVGGSEWDPGSALTALAEGQARCAMTGDAFEHMLQCGDLSMLETVMRNVVVCARFRPYQVQSTHPILSPWSSEIMVDCGVHYIEGWHRRSLAGIEFFRYRNDCCPSCSVVA